jgi:predicted adenylyl cyclase CyaB
MAADKRDADVGPSAEVELKAVVGDEAALRARIERSGGRLTFAGLMTDRRYDDARRRLSERDEVLRLRVYRDLTGAVVQTYLEWKGPTSLDQGYKVREELSTSVSEPSTLDQMLVRLGFAVVREIDRAIAQYALDGTVVRVERYPRMDVLVEVEGSPDAIERAISALAIPRSNFSAARLADFAAAFEARTGARAALCDRELAGDYCWRE